LTRLEDANKELAQVADCTIRYTWPTTSKREMDLNPQPEGGRILFAWSHGDEDSVPWESHLLAIESACAAMGVDEKQRQDFFQHDIDMVPHATFKEVYSKIEQAAQEGRPYSIVHLLCHGGMLDGNDGVGLVLTDDDDRKRGFADDGRQIIDVNDLKKVTVSPDTLATLFDGADKEKPRLMVLCACLGSAMDPGSHLGSVALAIHRTGIESVISSRFLLSKPGSIMLSESVYGAVLGRSDSPPTSIENAVRMARAKLRIDNSATSDYAAIQLFQNTMGWDTRPVVFRPYRGLRPFRKEDAPLFFGRTKEIEEACNDLTTLIQSGKPRLSIIIGASGTGKSSLVFAGIIPRLQKDRKDKSPWLDVTMRPRDGVQAVDEACKRATIEKKDLLLVVDQFEEIFTDIADERTRDAFVQKLLDVAGDKESAATVIVTLRSDFLNRCGDVSIGNGKRLDSVVNDKDHQVFVSLMERDALQEVIQGPASWTGIALDEMLVHQMLNDAGQEPGALPLMQNALDELWQNRSRQTDGRYALSKKYDKLTTALINKADSIIDQFKTQEKKDTAKRILVQLVDMRDDASPYTRRRVPKDEIRKGLVGKDVFHEVLETLTTECLVVQSEKNDSQQAIVEISHEQIVRSWGTLGIWLKEERQRLVDMRRFEKWIETATKDDTYVLQGGELALACELRTKYENEDVLGEKELDLVRRSEDAAARIAEAERKRQEALDAARRRASENALMAGARENASVKPHLAALLLMEVQEPENVRGWMQLASDVLTQPFLKSTRRHASEVLSAHWSVDGDHIMTTSADGVTREWNADGSGDARILAAGKMDDTSLLNGKTISNRITSPDGKRVALVHDDNGSWTVHVANADASSKNRPIELANGFSKGKHEELRCVVWSIDGSRIFIGGQDLMHNAIAQMLNADGSDKDKPTVLIGHEGSVVCAAWSPDGKRIATGSVDNTVRVWNADGIGRPKVFNGHEGQIHWVGWSQDSRRILTVADDATARVWHVYGSGELEGDEGKVRRAAWSPDGQRLLTVSGDVMRVWNTDEKPRSAIVFEDVHIHQLRVIYPFQRLAAWSPDSRRIAIVSNDGTARVCNADGSKNEHPDIFGCQGEGEVEGEDENKSSVECVGWSPDGQRIVTASHDGNAQIWYVDGANKTRPIVLEGQTRERLRSAAWSPDGQRIFTVSESGSVRVWKVDGSDKKGRTLVGPGGKAIEYFIAVAWSEDSKTILIARGNGTIEVWEADVESDPHVIDAGGVANEPLAWSSDRKRMVAISSRTAIVWSLDDLSVTLKGYSDDVGGAEFSPDGKRVVIASGKKTVGVWSAETWGDPLILRGHEDSVFFAGWSPDNQYVVTGSEDCTARIWPVTVAALQQALRAATTDCLTPDQRQTYLGETLEDSRARYEENERKYGRTPVLAAPASNDAATQVSAG
jgi:WD40 repeat protein